MFHQLRWPSVMLHTTFWCCDRSIKTAIKSATDALSTIDVNIDILTSLLTIGQINTTIYMFIYFIYPPNFYGCNLHKNINQYKHCRTFAVVLNTVYCYETTQKCLLVLEDLMAFDKHCKFATSFWKSTV